MELSLKDRKILYYLDLNSRQSYRDLAKKVGLSKDAVIYRVNRMVKSGIIKGFHTIIDVGKLGHISFRLFLKFRNTTPDKEKEIIDFLKKQKHVGWAVSVEGSWDLNMWIICKSIEDINDFWDALKKYKQFIANSNLSMFSKAIYFDKSCLLNVPKSKYKNVFLAVSSKKTDLQKIDFGILSLIATNARLPVLDISKKLNTTSKTISQHVKNLEKNDVILGYRLMLDLEKIGYQYYKIHANFSELNEEKQEQIRKFMASHPNIIYDNEMIAGYDFEADAYIKNPAELRKLINEIKSRFAPSEIEVLHYFEEHKYVCFPVEIEESV